MKFKKSNLLVIILFLSLLLLPFFTYAQNEYYKDRVGLNTHWALGGFGRDNGYNLRLRESKTRWVREHFYTEVFLSQSRDAWLARYDYVLKKYKENNINVVGMLAYAEKERRFWPPYEDNWKNFIRTVVSRYKNQVKVWEVWNEPDSPDYLILNNPQTYIPILETAFREIKQIDPTATVLVGGLSWPNVDFARDLYEKSGKFDALAFHIYSCNDYFASGNFSSIEGDLLRLKEVVSKYKGGRKAWITELGCSTSNHLSESQQAEYLKKIIPYLFNLGFIEKILLYNIRNYNYGDSYEDNFGLLTSDLSPRASWYWYKGILQGPYNKSRLSLDYESAKAKELKTNLEKYFGQGLIPVSAPNWPTLVSAYVYGEYPVQAIVQAIRFGGKTVHPSIPYKFWQETDTYKEFINKNWTGGLIIYAYGKPRQLITLEQQKAQELRNLLSTNYNFSKLRIDINNWDIALKAYVYGGYPLEAVVRIGKYPGTVVHTEIPYETWKDTAIYKEYISKNI